MSKNGIKILPSNNLFLTGFMGSGKTTVGLILAKKLNWRFIDIDHEIESKMKMSIPAIFQNKGEKFFRTLENEVIRLVSSHSAQVIALGGGSLLMKENQRRVKQQGKLIYLRAELQTLIDRLKDNSNNRPLLKNKKDSELQQAIKTLVEERNPIYQQSDWCVVTDHRTPFEVAELILTHLNPELVRR